MQHAVARDVAIILWQLMAQKTTHCALRRKDGEDAYVVTVHAGDLATPAAVVITAATLSEEGRAIPRLHPWACSLCGSREAPFTTVPAGRGRLVSRTLCRPCVEGILDHFNVLGLAARSPESMLFDLVTMQQCPEETNHGGSLTPVP